MSTHFSQELNALKQTLTQMAARAEGSVIDAMRAFADRDETLALKVKADDQVLDDYEIEVDETSVNLLAKAPLASDLRLITIAMKISHDLERVGDEATTIARRARMLIGLSPVNLTLEIPSMADKVLAMLRAAIESFVRRDPARARAIIPEDKLVDALNRKIYQSLAEYMVQHPDEINACLHLMFVAKSLERIGDHATNIAEEVVYLCEALDVRHDPRLKAASA